MSDELNVQAAPESEVIEQTGNESIAEVSAEADSSIPVSEVSDAPTEAGAEEEKISFTQKEIDNMLSKKEAIAKRKAKREVEREYAQKLVQPQVSNANFSQPESANSAPANYEWDNVLGWVPAGTSAEERYNMIQREIFSMQSGQAPQQQNNAYSAPQQVQQNNVIRNDSNPGGLSDQALEQIDEVSVEHDDFMATAGQIVTPAMANATGLFKDGMKSLYKINKDNPLALFNISKLSPVEQQYKVWELLKKHEGASKVNKVTKVAPVPAPLEANGTINDDSNLSFTEKRLRKLHADNS